MTLFGSLQFEAEEIKPEDRRQHTDITITAKEITEENSI